MIGLGFGDCGKGLFVDSLCRRWKARAVVRFNGGAQAGHNVVLPDGRHHTFSQFGSGTFVPGVKTILCDPMIVHPGALLVENAHLGRQGVTDTLERLVVDARCRINTPFHQAAGRIRELSRGDGAHGTCGVGVGETVRQDLSNPELTLRYGHLLDRRKTLEQLEAIRINLLPQMESLLAGWEPIPSNLVSEWGILTQEGISRRWYESIQELLRSVKPSGDHEMGSLFHQPGTVLFEGAQGMLLDQDLGFHPHTTWSAVGPSAVDRLASGFGLPESVVHMGATRSYLTRHGNGPFPTEDLNLDGLVEPHNTGEGWQGRFRRGHPDALLLRYALGWTNSFAGLLVSHLDAVDEHPLKWCVGYRFPGGKLERLPKVPPDDLGAREALTDLLKTASPCYDPWPIQGVGDLLERISGTTELPILFGSKGNTFESTEQLGR